MELHTLNPKKKLLIVAGLLFISFFSRFFLLSAGPFDCDTLDYVIAGKNTLESLSLVYARIPGYPLTVLASAFCQLIGRALGVDEVRVVIVATAFLAALATLVFFFWVNKVFSNYRVGLLSALIYSFFPTFFSITTYGRLDYPLSHIFIIASLYLLHQRTVRNIFLSGIFFSLAVAARFSSSLIVFAWLSFYFLSAAPGRRKISLIAKELLLFSLGTILPLLLYLPLILKSGLAPFIEFISSRSGGQWLVFVPYLIVLSLRWLLYMFTGVGIYIIILGGIIICREKIRMFLALLIWFLATLVYFANLSVVSPRLLLIPAFPLFIFEGYALSKLKNSYLSYLIVIVIISISSYSLFPILNFRARNNLQKEFAAYVKKNTKDSDVILAHDESIFLNYYLEGSRQIERSPVIPEIEKIKDFFNKIDSWLRQGNVYIVHTAFECSNCSVFRDELFKRYRVVKVGEQINQDWHRKSVFWGIFKERVFKIKWK